MNTAASADTPEKKLSSIASDRRSLGNATANLHQQSTLAAFNQNRLGGGGAGKFAITPRKMTSQQQPALKSSQSTTFQSLKQRKSPTRALNPHQLTSSKQLGSQH